MGELIAGFIILLLIGGLIQLFFFFFAQSTLVGIIGVIVFIAIILILGLISYMFKKEAEEDNKKVMTAMKKALQEIVDKEGGCSSIIAIDEEWKKLLIIESKGFTSQPNKTSKLDTTTHSHLYSFHDIIDYELLINDEEIISTDNASWNIAAGAYLVGGIGAMLGRLLSQDQKERNIYRLDLKIKIHNF